MDRHPQDSRSFGGSGGSSWLRDNGWGDSGQQEQSRSFGFGWNNEQQQQHQRSFSYWSTTEEEEEEQRRRAKDIQEHGYDDAGAMDDDLPTTATSAAAASFSSSSEPSTALGLAGSGWTEAVAAIVQRNAKDKPAFKSLLIGKSGTAGGAKTDAAAAAALPSAATSAAPTPQVSPYLKSIRFVRAKDQTLAEKSSSADSAEGAAVHKHANRVGLAKPNLLSRAAPALKPSAAAPSSRTAPSLLAPFKSPKPVSSAPFKPLVPGAGASAATTTCGSSGSGFALAHIFHVSYRAAQRKKKPHREGYLHLFRSSVATVVADATSATSSAATAASVSLIKSHLYSERGHLIDEQLGSNSVMQYDESITKPQRKQRNPFGGDGGGSGSKQMKQKRGDEVEWDSDDSDEDGAEDGGGFGFGGGGSAGFGSRLAEFNATNPISSTAAPTASSGSLPNVFAEGETVFLGSYECNLEEEITAQEYEKKKRIMTSSVSLLGAPLAPDNRGYILLAAQGLAANGGVIGRARSASTALKEPIAMVWRMQDSRPGVGFKEKPRILPGRHEQREGGHRGGRGGRGGGRF